jgi:hypothetical protein
LLTDDKEPKISGYLIIGDQHYQIVGQRISNIRTNLFVKHAGEMDTQADMFDDRSQPSDSKCDLP